MKKNSIFICMVVLPLMLASCAKSVFIENPEPEIQSGLIDPWTASTKLTETKAYPGNPVAISADFTSTKSHLEASGSVMKVVWDANDQFKMLACSDAWYGATYTTTSGGERAEFTPDYGMPSDVALHSFYAPLCTVSHLASLDDEWGFGINIPTEQTAVENNVQKGLNYAYAKTSSTTEDFHFRSMLALVRFKMSGSIAFSVTSVTLRGGSALAGDCVIVPANDGTPQVTFSKNFGGDVASPTVTLSGSFKADTYYYFAVAPGTQTSFSLTFAGATGTTTKIATKTVTFARGQINDIGTIALGDTFTDPDTPSTTTIKYMEATAGAPKPVTIAVIPDGFQASEMSKYEMLAKSAINTLFNVEPFKSYKSYFNVYILKKASNASGARITDGTETEQTRACYFESSWAKNSYNNMTANETKIRGFVTDNCPDIGTEAGQHSINEVPILMIINDSRYGGICHTSSSGFSYCMAPYTYNGGGITWSYPSKEAVSDSDSSEGYYQDTPADRFTEVGANVGNWLNTMVHEFGGHCFSRLADEYWNGITDKGSASYIEGHRWDSSYSGVPYGLNVSATYTNPGYDNPNQGEAYIKQGWQHLLDKRASLPNTDIRKTRIGVYQGGDGSILNRWRSERISCMIDNRFYFSTFQRELIVKRIMSLAGASFDFNTFWANDVAVDPVRDVISSQVMGETDPVEPRPMPLLPPPVFHMDW